MSKVQAKSISRLVLSLAFSVKQFKMDQNKNQNRSIDKVQNLGMQRRLPRFRSHILCKICGENSTQIYRDLYGDAMRVPINMAAGN